jgi:hypothetical protein
MLLRLPWLGQCKVTRIFKWPTLAVERNLGGQKEHFRRRYNSVVWGALSGKGDVLDVNEIMACEIAVNDLAKMRNLILGYQTKFISLHVRR